MCVSKHEMCASHLACCMMQRHSSCVRVHARIRHKTKQAYVNMRGVCMHVCVCVYLHTHTCKYTHTPTKYVYIRLHIQRTHTHTQHIYIRIHMYIHTYIHTYTSKVASRLSLMRVVGAEMHGRRWWLRRLICSSSNATTSHGALMTR